MGEEARPKRVLDKFIAAGIRQFLRVVCIRQAESTNNILTAEMMRQATEGRAAVPSADERALLLGRLLADPGLSPHGKQQAEKMSHYWAPIFQRVPANRLHLYGGPMLRNLQVGRCLLGGGCFLAWE